MSDYFSARHKSTFLIITNLYISPLIALLILYDVGRSAFPLLTLEHQKLQEIVLEYLPMFLLNSVSNLFLFRERLLKLEKMVSIVVVSISPRI